MNENINFDQSQYVIVRTDRAGVFSGYIQSREGNSLILKDARRIWYWDGANTLSQLAMEGTSKPKNCKFPCEVDKIELFGVIEILNITEKAEKSIKDVPTWNQ